MNVLMKTMMVAVACAMFINMEVVSVPIDMVEETQPVERLLVHKGPLAKVRHNKSTTVYIPSPL